MKPLIPLALAALLSGLAPVLRAEPAPEAKVDYGEIGGAQYAIASPPGDWNRNLLLIAHGYRPEKAPLIPDLHPERAYLRAVLDAGWMVATTSYRRNGVVVGDAIADLDALRAHIAEAYAEPRRVILEGESLGGLIVTIMAERDAGPYQGAVVFDATLYAKENNSAVGLSLLPRIPLLFVATLREATQPKSYLYSLVSRPFPVIQPALFLINREGHTNINQAEHLECFEAINAWVERGPGRRRTSASTTPPSSPIPARRPPPRTRTGAASTAGWPRSTGSTATCSSRPRRGISPRPGSLP